MSSRPTSVLSRELLPASVAVYTVVALAAFEGLAVTAALPQVAADLGDVALLPWVVTGFLLMSGVATVAAGPLVDSLGLRLTFRVGVSVFVAGAVLAAVATSMPLMILARLVHGAGGGAVIAVALAATGLIFPDHLVGRAFAANATVWGVMGVAGPGIAGFMLTTLNWRWIFLVNIPLGLLSLAAGWRVMPGPLGESGRRLDLRGLLAVLVLNSLLLVAVDTLSWSSLLWLAAATVASALLWWHVRRTPDPIMEPRHLATQPYWSLAVGTALLVAGAIAVSAYITLFVRGGRGASELLTAWSVFFFVIGWTIGANLSSRLMDRRPETTVILTGFAFTIPGLAVLGTLVAVGAPLPAVLGVVTVVSLGVGLATNASLTLLRALSAGSEIGRATAAHQFFRNQGFTLGAAMGGAVMLAVVSSAIGDLDLVREVLQTGEVEDPATAAAIVDGFATAIFVGFGVSLSGLVPMIMLRRHLAPARAHRRTAA